MQRYQFFVPIQTQRGHVGPEGGDITVSAIKEIAPELQKQGIKFVTAKELLELKSAAEAYSEEQP